MNKKRLLKLADFLEKEVPNQNFHLCYVGRGSVEDISKYRCGSSACAMGWLPAVFPRTFKWLYQSSIHTGVTHTKIINKYLADIVINFFQINILELHYLFYPGFYRSKRNGKRAVITRIRCFVKTGKSHHNFCGGNYLQIDFFSV